MENGTTPNRNFILRTIISSFLVSIFILLGIFVASKLGLNWGKIEFLPASTITVTGEAKKQETNQIASYYVAVSANSDDKQDAINQVNSKMEEIIKKVKEFDIDEKDIQTQNVSVNENQQAEILFYPPKPDYDVKKWSATNSISLTLRDIEKAGKLADMLNTTGATSVSGPNYSLDNTNEASEELLTDAINDAREKAQKIAKASGRRLGKVITVSESGSPIYYPMLERAGMGGDTKSIPTPVEPGSQTVYKSVTVVFELR